MSAIGMTEFDDCPKHGTYSYIIGQKLEPVCPTCAVETQLAAALKRVKELEEEKIKIWNEAIFKAAEICGSLAETVYDDAPEFDAVLVCEDSVLDLRRAVELLKDVKP